MAIINGVSDAAAGVARLAGGALADDPGRRRNVVGPGYATRAVPSAGLGARSRSVADRHAPGGGAGGKGLQAAFAGVLWTAVSPTAAFVFLAGAMAAAVPLHYGQSGWLGDQSCKLMIVSHTRSGNQQPSSQTTPTRRLCIG